MTKILKVLGTIGVLAVAGSVCNADEVTYWSGVVRQAIRVNGGAPCPIGRGIAMTHIAMYEAHNSIVRTHEPYERFVSASRTASKEAAIAQACHDVLIDVYPAQAAIFDAELAARLALIPDGPAKTAGIAVGAASAAQCVASRIGDGHDVDPPYTFGSNPGDYVTPEDLPPNTPPFSPGWGSTRSFCMATSDQFRLTGPLGFSNMSELLASSQYADQFDEIKRVGGRVSAERTEDQTALAFFWANDVNGTYKPPGHLLNITDEISAQQNLTLEQNARLFGMVGLAQGDAGVVAWDMKYNTDTDLWRPISGIRRADTDGNPATIADPEWLPLNSFTPPFPAWVSGHSTFGGATSAVLERFFGTDTMTFTISSEDPFFLQLPEHGNRTFHSFSSMGFEDAISRIYLGVHWRTDCEDGYLVGQQLGHHIGDNFFRTICPADFNGDRFNDTQDFFEYLTAFFAQAPEADFNADAVISSADFFEYLTAFLQGGC